MDGRSGDLQSLLTAVAENAALACRADDALLGLIEGDSFRAVAHFGSIPWPGTSPVVPLSREKLTGRAMLDRHPVHVPDLWQESFDPALRELAQRDGWHTALAVPLIGDLNVVGGILIRRAEVQPFNDEQIDRLQTFARLAALAVEHAQLRHDLEARNTELAEALYHRDASAEVLGIIGRSPTDLQPVLDTIAQTAARVCRTFDVLIRLVDGESMRVAAHVGGLDVLRPVVPIESGGRFLDRLLIEKRSLAIVDSQNQDQFPRYRDRARQNGVRSRLDVPMIRGDQVIGVIEARRNEVRPFTPAEIELVETFAAQAVIAIENTRLFTELKERNEQLQESLERQTATAEVLGIISQSPADVHPVLEAIAASMSRLLQGADVMVRQREGDLLRNAAHAGDLPVSLGSTVSLGADAPASITGRAVAERRTIEVRDILSEEGQAFPISRQLNELGHVGSRTSLATPLLRDGEPLGAILIRRTEVKPFTDAEIALIESFANQAVIAIENARLFDELKAALDRQTATSEVLKIISSSITDATPVFESITRAALRVLGTGQGAIWVVDGDELLCVAEIRSSGRGPQYLGTRRPIQDGRTIAALTIQAGRTVNIPDASLLDEQAYGGIRMRLPDMQALLATPMIREGQPIGVLVFPRNERRPFTPEDVALIETFAAQAVIAIENVRLFKELNERNAQLQEALERQTATAEVLDTIARSPTDVQAVLDAIAASAARLLHGSDVQIRQIEGEVLRRASHVGEVRSILGDYALDQPGLVSSRALAERRTVHIADLLSEEGVEFPLSRSTVEATGSRTVLATPLLREGAPIGVLLIRRAGVDPFTEAEIGVLETFANQAVIAMENARLYQEIQQKAEELAQASRHKSEFLANMSHELRTPLNAIIGFSDVLADKMLGELNDQQEDFLHDIQESGRHLLSLINDILDLSKIEAGQLELEPSSFSLPEVLESSLTMVRERASNHGIRLGIEVGPGVETIEADERKVKQVLFNLLSNAVKFTPDGGRVDVTATQVDGEVEIAVRDTGVGIAPEDQERIFEEFQQARQSPLAAKVEGTGLGLTLTRRFVELHGGRIWVESELGRGSTFTFTLPVQQSEPGKPQTNAPAPEIAAATGSVVLLVEDDPHSVNLMTLYLKEAGLPTAVARDGEEGLRLARSLQPSAIVLDIMLPQVDGWAFLARLKSDPAIAHIPVVIASVVDERGKGLALGAVDYLVKPVAREELLAAVRRCLTLSSVDEGPRRVLAVDDDPMAIELVRTVLTGAGYEVLTASGGAEGVRLAREQRPDLLVLDLLMPEVDGFAVVEQLRGDPATAGIPIVILTSKTTSPADRERLAGRISFLAHKSEFNRAEFVQLVQRLVWGV